MSDSLTKRLGGWQRRVESELDRWLPAESVKPQRLHAAQRYSVFGPGKRIRPALVYATAETLDVPLERVDAAACAVELIHAYSLVHDDLPAMDDDDLRRGRPTCHRASTMRRRSSREIRCRYWRSRSWPVTRARRTSRLRGSG
jgi:geranylgeranyl pyrophosphate synthase